MTTKYTSACLALSLAIACLLPSTPPAAAQDEGDLRGMKLQRFVGGRPRGKSTARVRYRRTGPATAAATPGEIGLTIWRLRPSEGADPVATREIVYRPAGGRDEVTPERVGGGTALAVGQRFRLGLETPHRGYLYVVNQSEYEGGVLRDPYLIFPTTALRHGDNRVRGGRLFEIPARRDDPPFFEIDGGPGLVAEQVVVIVSPEPLDLALASDRAALDPARVREWERTWGAPVEVLEMVGGEGRTPTPAEAQAAVDRVRLLDGDDALPQTIYRVAAKPGAPLFLRVRIPVVEARP
jgi:hypothetical protein